MKAKLIASLLFAALAIVSCNKNEAPEEVPEEHPQDEGDSLFVRLQRGIIPGHDTVHLITYDEKMRIAKIEDSTRGTIYIPEYNSSGTLSSFTIKHPDQSPIPVTFEYDAENRLKAIYWELSGQPERFEFEYVNGIISRKNRYIQTMLNDPTLRLFEYTIYEVTDSNITRMREYGSANDLRYETIFTYTSELNIFKPVSLLNSWNYLGLRDVANIETFFNKNLIAGFSRNGEPFTHTYIYNNKKQLTDFTVQTLYHLYTYKLSY